MSSISTCNPLSSSASSSVGSFMMNIECGLGVGYTGYSSADCSGDGEFISFADWLGTYLGVNSTVQDEYNTIFVPGCKEYAGAGLMVQYPSCLLPTTSAAGYCGPAVLVLLAAMGLVL